MLFAGIFTPLAWGLEACIACCVLLVLAPIVLKVIAAYKGPPK